MILFNFNLLSHHYHDHDPSSSTSIPFNPITCMLLPYPALLALYDTNVPRLVNPSAPPLFPDILPLTLLYFSRNHFRFLSQPTFSPLTFLRHSSFLLMTSILATFFFVFIISESPVHEGSRRDYSCLYLYLNGRRSTVPLPVSYVSCCISSHSSYYPHRHLIKLFSPFLS